MHYGATARLLNLFMEVQFLSFVICSKGTGTYCSLCRKGRSKDPDPTRSVAGVLDYPHSQLSPFSGVAVQARQSGTVSTCSLAGRYGYSAERD